MRRSPCWRGQGALCRRAGGADRRRDPRPGARRGRTRRGRLCAAARRDTAAAARAAGAPLLSAEVPGNLCLDWQTGDRDAVDAAFAAAAHVVSAAARQPPRRHQPDRAARRRRRLRPGDGPLHAHVSAPEHPRDARPGRPRARRRARRVRFVAPDVGGGFGAKNFIYPEHVLLPWAARRVGRPVKWIASRSEVFLADHQGRGQRAEASLALDADGRFLALRVDSLANLGAYLAGSAGGVQTFQYAFLPGTVYAIPAIDLRSRRSFTNTAPIGVIARPRLCRSEQHHRAADRRGGAADAASTAPSCGVATWCRLRRCR